MHHPLRFASLTTVALLLAASLAGCSKPPAPPTGPNVLLIAVDTLRADKLGCYGSELGATPKIDTLAAEGVRFTEAYAHAPWTLASFASLFTSQSPPQHGAGGYLGQFSALPDGARTVAECFRDAGYATAAIVNVDFLTHAFGMDQGFEHFDHKTYQGNVEVRDAAETTDAAIQWLTQRPRRPFFLMVHYFDPHLVYNPPLEFRQKFADPRDRDNRDWVFGTEEQIIALRAAQRTPDTATVQRAEKLYNGEIAYTDQQVGRLLAALAADGLADSTIVVFFADHGEEFLDHGGFEHGHTLYNELVHVPLLLRYPGHLAPGVVIGTVGLKDVAPTLCTLSHIPVDPAFCGQNLLDLIANPGLPGWPVLLEGNFWGPPYQGWLYDGYKLVVRPDGVKQLFNLRSDPHEHTDLATTKADLCSKLLADLKAARDLAISHSTERSTPVQVPPEALERLRSLGYVK